MKNVILGIILVTSMFYNAQQKEDFNLKGEKARVANGIKSGELKPKEVATIAREAKDLRRVKYNAKKDGHVTPKERAKIAKKDLQLDKTIYRKKHN